MKAIIRVFLLLVIVGAAFHYYHPGSPEADLPVSESYPTVSSHYSYNSLMTEEAREVYERIQKSVYKTPGEENELCRIKGTDETQFYLGYRAFKEDHPDVFWMQMGVLRGGLKTEGCYIASRFPAEQLEEMKSGLRSNLEAFLESVPAGLEDEELAEYAHDYLLDHCVYDYEALDEGSGDQERRILAGTAYSALVDGMAICEGYSRAYQLLLSRVGVDCVVIHGKGKAENAGGSTGACDHAWNAVKNGMNWSMTDVTWDDTGADPKQYFALTTDEMYESHTAKVLDMDTYRYNTYFRFNNDGDSLFLPE